MDKRYSELQIQENKHGIFVSMIVEWTKRFFPDQLDDLENENDEVVGEVMDKVLQMWNDCIEKGWMPQPLGFYTKSDGTREALDGWIVLERITKKKEVIPEQSEKTAVVQSEKVAVVQTTAKKSVTPNRQKTPENPINKGSLEGSSPMVTVFPLGSPKEISVTRGDTQLDGEPNGSRAGGTPAQIEFPPMATLQGKSVASVLDEIEGAFSKFESLALMKEKSEHSDCLLVGFDTEYYYIQKEGSKEPDRLVLSYQFAYFDLEEDLHEVIIMGSNPTNLLRLKLEYPISYICNSIGIPAVKSEDKYWKIDVNTPEENAKKYYQHNKKLGEEGKINKICLLCHNGRADLTTLAHEANSDTYRVKSVYNHFLRYPKEVGKAVVSVDKTLTLGQKDYSYTGVSSGKYFNITLIHRDTMAQASAGKRSLEACANTINMYKLPVADEYKEHMDVYFDNHFYSFLEYGSNDSIITLLYFQALYGKRNKGFATITGMSGQLLVREVSKTLGIEEENKSDAMVEWDKKYRGLKMVKKGLEVNEDGRLFEKQGYEPVTYLGQRVNQLAQDCYKGGCNESFYIGLIEGQTFDVDGMNCYPTAMALLPIIDWENPFSRPLCNIDLDLSMFTSEVGLNPCKPGFFYVRFEFPEDTYEPCLGCIDEGNIFYPLSSEGIDGCFATAPEVFLALQLGAKVHCIDGFFLNFKLDDQYRPLSVFGEVLKRLVSDRRVAVEDFGKKSLVELILKVCSNSSYGKVAQAVKPKSTWNAYVKGMEELGCSFVTNPVYASMITGIVRAQVKSAINQLHTLGYDVYSLTTDGFITNAPLDTIQNLDLYGLAGPLHRSRFLLTSDDNGMGGDGRIWEVKHHQNTLINLTTRGNVGVEESGVLAHAGYKGPYPSDTPEDRRHFIDVVTTRTAPTRWTCREDVSIKEILEGNKKDYYMYEAKKTTRFDFDFKRKPLWELLRSEYFENREIVTFDTVPYKNMAEATKYKKTAKQFTEERTLRTMEDYEDFKRTLLGSDGKSIRIIKRDDCVRHIVMGHYQGLWELPMLAEKHTVDERMTFLNSFRTKPITYATLKQWKRRSVGRNIPNREGLEPILTEMIEYKIED